MQQQIQRILGITVHNYRGCGRCPAEEACEAKWLKDTVVTLQHVGDEQWDNGGDFVRVFEPGDLVEVRIRHDENAVYCVTAESTCYKGVSDFINLRHWRVPEGA